MAGFVKPKKYDWKDSNVALFGSDVEKNVKAASAQTEDAWRGAGEEVGLQIWRIVKFKVTHWPKDEYGSFFTGDSYIILNTYHPNECSEELLYDVHFWIGSSSTQDEYATAAYKTVELDIFLDDRPVQHREVEGHESQLFRSYFKKGLIIMEGGAESGFRRVEEAKYKPRLLKVSGSKKHVTISEVPCSKKMLNSYGVFILDIGTSFFQWNGSKSNKDERFKAMQFMVGLKSERKYKIAETIEECGTRKSHTFYTSLTDEDDVLIEETNKGHDQVFVKTLYRVSDASGKLKLEKVKEGEISMTDFDTMDVFILDTGEDCFVWIGGGATLTEKRNGLPYAHNHLMTTNHPLVPVVVVREGQKNAEFFNSLDIQFA